MRICAITLLSVFLSVQLSEAQELTQKELTTVDGTKFGYINSSGERVGKAYDYVYPFKNGYAVVKKAGKLACVDKSVKELTPFKYDKIEDFNDGVARVTIADKMGFIDTTGKEICPIKYIRLRYFAEGYATASEEEEGRTGFIDRKGRMFSRFHYDNAGSFKEGLAWVEKDGKVGFIDHRGAEVIPLNYDWVDPDGFQDGVTIVQQKKMGLINKKQQVLIPLEFDDVKYYGVGFKFIITGKGKKGKERYGLYTSKGKEILPTNFIKITPLEFVGDRQLAKVYFDPLVSKQPFFYINEKLECETYEGIPCPEK